MKRQVVFALALVAMLGLVILAAGHFEEFGKSGQAGQQVVGENTIAGHYGLFGSNCALCHEEQGLNLELPWMEWKWETNLLEGGVIQAEKGETILIDLVLVKAPTGLKEYDLHFQLANALEEEQIGKIKGVQSIAIEEEICQSTISPDPEWQGLWINFSCEDKNNQVRRYDRGLKVAVVELEALKEGSSYLQFRLDSVDDDQNPVVNRFLPPIPFILQVLE